MLCCAVGAETRVKADMAEEGWRLAFSRPGFVTAKHDQTTDLPAGIFIRTSSHSLGQLRGGEGNQLITELNQLLLDKSPFDDAAQPFDQLHVWPRDRLPIGKFGFEPGLDEVSLAVADEMHKQLKEKWVKSYSPNLTATAGQRILDVVLIDPSHWFVGWHEASDCHSCWPGGVQPIEPPQEPVSRAYYKAAESIAWSEFPMQPGDTVVEIGSAPGGACGYLLELGMNVIGIDPAEMDEQIMDHPNFKHLRARAGDLPRHEYSSAKWLLTDSNVKPDKTLTTIHNIVTHRQCKLEGLLLTLKLGDYEVARKIPQWINQVMQWKPKSITLRQLARNRCEVCMAIRM
ncbi:putative 23S rRNA ribose 2'-O-ribose methyltransferase [Stieleria bergensis]|uniref:Putative 23S rRNA ribose 2'-O-ribose methyltransferase n=2 Tax=Stieleria bergensis TaxID=2528025 RepID=A0A517SPE0_9BACT|nr:putative 23S rRNA ribose 2'-O-ribose methyltransferase [Planctomycetes bacterium SV_7m_r]